MEIALVIFIAGLFMSIIGYFLKQTMSELKEVKNMAMETKSKLDVLSNDHYNKYASLVEKFEELRLTLKDLICELKEINKKK